MKTYSSKHMQKGAILIVALVMLLLLTVIGISSMRGTTLQERMASNMRDQNMALQAAESSLRKAESVLDEKFTADTMSTLNVTPVWVNHSAVSITGLAAAPRYRMTPIANLSTSTEAGLPPDEGYLVRVEAEGFGITKDTSDSAGSTVQIRSTYLLEP
jgi:type IV pilus assembly protein PilX